MFSLRTSAVSRSPNRLPLEPLTEQVYSLRDLTAVAGEAHPHEPPAVDRVEVDARSDRDACFGQ